jgi:hypothetical protein
MSKIFDVVAITGTYTANDGQEKNRYLKCGAVFKTDKGVSIKLEGLPVGSDWNGWLSCYEPERKANTTPQPTPQPAAQPIHLEDLPF